MSESLLEFPCEFPIKIMGRHDPEFREAALFVVEKYAGKVADGAIRTSMSTNGNFVSITVTITATSQRQLDDIYRDLTAHEQVLVAL